MQSTEKGPVTALYQQRVKGRLLAFEREHCTRQGYLEPQPFQARFGVQKAIDEICDETCLRALTDGFAR